MHSPPLPSPPLAAVVVNYYAPWCPWCQRLGPTWEAVTEAVHDKYPESDGRLRFAKAGGRAGGPRGCGAAQLVLGAGLARLRARSVSGPRGGVGWGGAGSWSNLLVHWLAELLPAGPRAPTRTGPPPPLPRRRTLNPKPFLQILTQMSPNSFSETKHGPPAGGLHGRGGPVPGPPGHRLSLHPRLPPRLGRRAGEGAGQGRAGRRRKGFSAQSCPPARPSSLQAHAC